MQFLRKELDVVEFESLKILKEPDVVINTTAYVRVDDAGEVDKAFHVNAVGALNIKIKSVLYPN